MACKWGLLTNYFTNWEPILQVESDDRKWDCSNWLPPWANILLQGLLYVPLIPSKELTLAPTWGRKGKSSTQKCNWARGNMWSFPGGYYKHHKSSCRNQSSFLRQKKGQWCSSQPPIKRDMNIPEAWIIHSINHLPSLKLTYGLLVSFWDGLFSGTMPLNKSLTPPLKIHECPLTKNPISKRLHEHP